MIRRIEREDAVLSTFLFANDFDLNLNSVFKLDLTAFSTKYRQRVAEHINNVKNGFYGYLLTQIEDNSINTIYEQDFLNIISQTPLTFDHAKLYHDDLVRENKIRCAV